LPRPVLSSSASLTSNNVKGIVEGSASIKSELFDEAVIGYELAQRLDKQVGDILVVNEHPLVIVGIWQPSILSPGNVVQVPYDTIRQWLPQSELGFDEMIVILAPGYDAERVARRIWDEVPQVEVLSPAQERAERRQTMLALELVVLYSVLLTVLVGGATTLNATLMATGQGKRSDLRGFDLGVGYVVTEGADQKSPSRHVKETSKVFGTVQPLLTALAGGLGGLLAGWLVTLGLNAYTIHHHARTLFIVTPRLAGGVVLLSGLIGLAAGVWPALCTRLWQQTPSSPFSIGLAVLGVALAIPGVMLIGSLVESLYWSLDEGKRVAANRISLEPISSEIAYYEPLANALRRWPGILGIAVEAYGGAIVEDEERWIDRRPSSGVVYGLRPALSIACPEPCRGIGGADWGDFGLGVPYRVGLWQGRVFQPETLDEAVIGYDLAARQGLRVGDTLVIRDHDFTVVGIRQRLVYGRMNDFNLRAEVSLEALRRVLGQPYTFGTITAFIPPAEREEDRELFLARLAERFSGTAVVTVKDRLAEIARDFPGMESLIVESSDDTLLRVKLLYLGLLAGVSVSLWGLAGLGIMSGLQLSVAESRQEIQVRKLFGASDGDILARWLERAALWGGLGGLMGVASGWLVIEAVNLGIFSWSSETCTTFAAQVPPSLTLIVTPRLVVTTCVVTVLLCVIASLGPAWQAARLSPVLSLGPEPSRRADERPLWENKFEGD
jgi:hypothetical protein